MLGIIHVPVAIPLIVGGAGNASSYSYPVLICEAEGCSVAEVTRAARDGVGQRIVAAARELERNGATAIAGDCGTLLRFQSDVSAAVSVPVALSPLLLVPLACALAGGTVGVLAADASNVGADELRWAGITDVHDVVIEGLETRPAWSAAIVNELGVLDPAALEADVLDGVRALQARAPRLRAIVLDCADMPPYGAALQAITGLAVFDALMLADLIHASTHRPSWIPAR